MFYNISLGLCPFEIILVLKWLTHFFRFTIQILYLNSMLIIWASKLFQMENSLNNQVVHINERYNFIITFISIQVHMKGLLFLKICYQIKKFFCRLFKNNIIWNKKNLNYKASTFNESYNFFYKFYLHPSWSEKVMIFLKMDGHPPPFELDVL
jgi:hypothetical protein